MALGILTLHLHLPGCSSLKEKRSRIKPILSRLHREFNVSVAEIDLQDAWHETSIGCAMISNDRVLIERVFYQVIHFLGVNWPDEAIIDQHIELL